MPAHTSFVIRAAWPLLLMQQMSLHHLIILILAHFTIDIHNYPFFMMTVDKNVVYIHC